MLEIIKALVELASKVVGAGDWLRINEHRQIGQKLLILYFRVNETIEGAERLISRMEHYRATTDWRRANGKESIYTATTHHFAPHYLMEEQALNLRRLGEALSELRHELSLVDPALARRLQGLIDGKSNAVAELSNRLRSRHLPLRSIPSEEFEADVEGSIESIAHRWLSFRDNSHTIEDLYGSETLYQHIVEYLDSGIPQGRIGELRRLENEMRESISKHWSLQETLPGAIKALKHQDRNLSS